MRNAGIYQEMSMLARQLNALNLAQGIPESLNDPAIREAVSQSLDVSWQYGPVEGSPELLAAVAGEYDNAFAPDSEIIVTSGCTESLLIALLSARKTFGPTVAWLEPFYSYYPGLAQLAGLQTRTIPLRCDGRYFALDLNDVERVFASGVRVLLLNTPHNPTGWVLDTETAIHLAALADKYDCLLIVDEVYRSFIYGDRAAIDFHRKPALRGRCLVANSVSKTFAATGMRVGWLAGPPELIEDALISHMHVSNCQPLALQAAAAHMIVSNDGAWRSRICRHYQRKRDQLIEALERGGFRCAVPSGGHFVLADYSALRADLDSRKFAHWFARRSGVVALPVDGFFERKAETIVRFSFAVPMADIERVSFRVEQAA